MEGRGGEEGEGRGGQRRGGGSSVSPHPHLPHSLAAQGCSSCRRQREAGAHLRGRRSCWLSFSDHRWSCKQRHQLGLRIRHPSTVCRIHHAATAAGSRCERRTAAYYGRLELPCATAKAPAAACQAPASQATDVPAPAFASTTAHRPCTPAPGRASQKERASERGTRLTERDGRGRAHVQQGRFHRSRLGLLSRQLCCHHGHLIFPPLGALCRATRLDLRQFGC